jgi:hypothetical protein
VVAQEVEAVVPEAVTPTREGLGVDYTKLVPVLIEAVKELKDQVDDLRAEVARLSAPAESAKAKPTRAASRARAAKAGA